MSRICGFACMHVIHQLRPVLYVHREDGDWIFTCGTDDHRDLDDWGMCHIHHLFDADASLHAVADLRPDEETIRSSRTSPWVRLAL